MLRVFDSTLCQVADASRELHEGVSLLEQQLFVETMQQRHGRRNDMIDSCLIMYCAQRYKDRPAMPNYLTECYQNIGEVNEWHDSRGSHCNMKGASEHTQGKQRRQ
jgi:hypothetical protein